MCALKVVFWELPKLQWNNWSRSPPPEKILPRFQYFFPSSGADSAKSFLYCEFYVTTSRRHGQDPEEGYESIVCSLLCYMELNCFQEPLARPRTSSPVLKPYASFRYPFQIFEDYVSSKAFTLENLEIRRRQRKDQLLRPLFTTPKTFNTSSMNPSYENSANIRLSQRKLDVHLVAMKLVMQRDWNGRSRVWLWITLSRSDIQPSWTHWEISTMLSRCYFYSQASLQPPTFLLKP